MAVREELSGIILASASARRRQLLAQAGYEFEVIPSSINEEDFVGNNITAEEYAKKLAFTKAQDVAKRYPDRLVIGADTVAELNGEIIGKPVDKSDAERIVRMLFSSVHKVITAIAVIRLADGIEIVESDTTIIYPRPMTEEQLTEHLESGTWQDKTGAYAIQEGGDRFIEKIEGSLTNVMGLPMELLGKILKQIAEYKETDTSITDK